MTSASTASVSVICLAVWLVASAARAEQQSFPDRISELVFDHFPDAVVTEEKDTVIAKHGAMVFAVHAELKKAVFDILPKAPQPPTSRHSTVDTVPRPTSKSAHRA